DRLGLGQRLEREAQSFVHAARDPEADGTLGANRGSRSRRRRVRDQHERFVRSLDGGLIEALGPELVCEDAERFRRELALAVCQRNLVCRLLLEKKKNATS